MSQQLTRRNGTRGTSLIVVTNSFPISRLPEKQFYQYHVEILEEVLGVRKQHEIIHKLQLQEASIFNPQAIYDGKSILFASHQLSLKGGAQTFTVRMNSDPNLRTTRGTFHIRLTLVNAVIEPRAHLQDLIEGKSGGVRAEAAINLLQLLIRSMPNQKYYHNLRSYFTESRKQEVLGAGIELWHGFFQSVRPSIGKMLVNVDTTMTAMYRRGPLREVALEFLGGGNQRKLCPSETYDPNFRKLRKLFIGLQVVISTEKLRNGVPRRRTIKDLVIQAGLHQFEKDGELTTVEFYFKQVHGRNLNFPNMFGIVVGKDSVIPAELCDVTPGQFYRKKIGPEFIKQVVKFATRKPQERLEAISKDKDSPAVGYANSSWIRDAGMAISTIPLEIKGRLLPPPVINFGQNQQEKVSKGGWNFVGSRFFQGATLGTWAVVNFSSSSDENVQKFIHGLRSCCQVRGMQINPQFYYYHGNGHDVQRSMRDAGIGAMRLTGRPAPELIVAILPYSAADVRRGVKQFGDIITGVATQCIRENKVEKPNDQYFSNVALKINARLGGQNSILLSPIIDKLKQEPYIVFGADVGHPGPGIRTQPSVSSLVWSTDWFASKYIAVSDVQLPRQEKIEGLKNMVKTALTHSIHNWSTRSNGEARPQRFLPKSLFFYRDGLSEGEFEQVARQEIFDINEACNEVWREEASHFPNGVMPPIPRLTFIVVGKRHHVRFFPRNIQEGDHSGNVPPGFVADMGISNPLVYDFYLQSHGGLLGTSRPSHYIVIEDQNFSMDMDKLQELSYALCHVYARATRSVSIPAPVYYADLVCTRGQDFYFKDELRYGDETTTTDSSESVFDEVTLKKWKDGYGRVHKSQREKMYFV